MMVPSVYGIFGWPVAHSRSPDMHNAAFRALGINGLYVAFPVAPKDLAQAVAGVRAMGICGLNVTLPHKTAIMAMLDGVEPAAQAIGAVNTIVCDGSRLFGHNTDAPGLARALQEQNVELTGKRTTVLGAGGAARAAVMGLGLAGAAEVIVAARRADAAQALIAALAGALPGTALRAVELADLASTFPHTDVLIQATSATLGENADADAFAASLPVSALPDHAVVNDLVYQPRVTSVLQACQARGLQTVDGLGMLLHQGALAFECWTGKRPPIDVMRKAFGM